MYAITFDLDTAKLQETYGNPSWQNAYTDIKQFLEKGGGTWQQGSVYLGDKEKVNAVTCVIATSKMSALWPWFSASVRDIQMLRIEENSDLSPVLNR